MRVQISAEGLSIPTDITSVRILVSAAGDGGATAYESADLPLCAPGTADNCYTLPVSVTLAPGVHPDETVRVNVTASDSNGAEITSDAALFSFTPEVGRQLDFILSPRCLHTHCAEIDRSCGRSGGCEQVLPTKTGDAPDLSIAGPVGGPIVRVYDDAAKFRGPLTLTPPQSLKAGDLILLLVSNGVTAPPGWEVVDHLGNGVTLYARRADATESGKDALYMLTADDMRPQVYLIVAYRGVTRYELNYHGTTPPFVCPSFDVTAAGSISLELVSPQTTLANALLDPCDTGDLGLTDVTLVGGEVIESQPQPLGPSGAYPITCPSYVLGMFQLWLIP